MPISPVDWKKVAAQRQAKLKCVERQCKLFRQEGVRAVHRELSVILHAHCVSRAAYEAKLMSISETVAQALTPYLPL